MRIIEIKWDYELDDDGNENYREFVEGIEQGESLTLVMLEDYNKLLDKIKEIQKIIQT